jgi:hypothetical protein
MSALVPPGMTAKAARRFLEQENRTWPETLTAVPKERWRAQSWDDSKRIRVLRSRRFMVQVFEEADGVLRLSVNRTELAPGGERWVEGITWDELQMLKLEAGYGDSFAIEIYPPALDEVNVANMRHLWILPERLNVGWRAA